MDRVARHDLARRNGEPLAVALGPRFERQRFLQCRDGVTGLELFPETDAGVHQQQRQNDAEVLPVVHDGRKDGGYLDHPRNWTPG